MFIRVPIVRRRLPLFCNDTAEFSKFRDQRKYTVHIGCARDAVILKIMMAAPSEAWHLVAEGPDENFEKVVVRPRQKWC